MAKFAFLVTVNVKETTYPETEESNAQRLGSRAIERHIRKAVECWGGQFHHEDLLFPSNIRKVTVVPVGEGER